MHVVDRLASVLLKVKAFDANGLGVTVNLDLDLAFPNDRLLELTDLIALR